jgi:hypothetical protein
MPPQPRLHIARRTLRLAIAVLLGCALAVTSLLSSSARTVVMRQPRSTGAARSIAYRRLSSGPRESNTGAHITMVVTPTPHGRAFPLGAVGLSIEADELSTSDISADHSSLVTLMRQLGPGVLRLGGNSLDYAWWTDRNEPAEPVPTWAKSVITPADLSALDQLLVATGWRAILGIDLGHFDPARAASEAHAAVQTLGSRLLGFEVGNEPNDYGHSVVKLRANDYTVANYLQELTAYTAAMRRAVGDVRLYGPDVSSQTWLAESASDSNVPFVALTQHYYPTEYNIAQGACKATPVPSALDLLSPQVREQEDTLLGGLVRIGELNHRQTRISETNTTASCDASGGPATSPVFASALWALDWALRAGSAGVSGINFHGYFGRCKGSAFSPICAPDSAAEARGLTGARPEYYGLFAARQLEGGHFIPVSTMTRSLHGAFSAYATLHPRGGITLALDNFDPSSPISLSLRVPGYRRAAAELLTAPSIDAATGVTLGHARVTPGGDLRPTFSIVSHAGDAFRIRVPRTSALIVELST